MPNWVYNDLLVAGPKDIVLDFVQKSYSQEETAFKIIPMHLPLECENTVDNQNERWGIKLGDCGTELLNLYRITSKMSVAHFRFETPWICPDIAVKRIAENYEELSFALSGIEEQPDWCGAIYIKHEDGEIILEDENLDLDPPNYPNSDDYDTDDEYQNALDKWYDNEFSEWYGDLRHDAFLINVYRLMYDFAEYGDEIKECLL